MEMAYKTFDGKVVIRLKDRVCESQDELLSSSLFRRVLKRCISDLGRRHSNLLDIFENRDVTDDDINLLIETFRYLTKLPGAQVVKIVDESSQFFRDIILFNDFVEYIYNYWRNLQRLIVCDSEGSRFDKRPYHTFNNTIETLTHMVRSTYRDVQESITGNHPRIYRQVRAGAEIATIALPRSIPYSSETYKRLNSIAVIRQILIYPPLIFTPPMNKRTGNFARVYQNPLENFDFHKDDWLCYPAKVGPLVINIYFSLHFFELGFSLCNLFELAEDEDLKRKPDAVFLYGVPDSDGRDPNAPQTIFYEDTEQDMLVATIPGSDEFGYFGYLKKMILTLHNIKMMKMGRLPFHGALFHIVIRDRGGFTVLVMGDTGAGKSETLEAMRAIGGNDLEDLVIIADDMGSVELSADGRVLGYGTETGAFVRLDDLQPGYAFGQIDRTIIMSPNQNNARVVLPVTTYHTIMQGYPVDFILYANNYEKVDQDHAIIEGYSNPDEALAIFRTGRVMSKGTTTTTGIVESYFANIFGPLQYPDVYDTLAKQYFKEFFARGAFVGQIRTQLGVSGMERNGPEEAARALLTSFQEGKAR